MVGAPVRCATVRVMNSMPRSEDSECMGILLRKRHSQVQDRQRRHRELRGEEGGGAERCTSTRGESDEARALRQEKRGQSLSHGRGRVQERVHNTVRHCSQQKMDGLERKRPNLSLSLAGDRWTEPTSVPSKAHVSLDGQLPTERMGWEGQTHAKKAANPRVCLSSNQLQA